LIPRYTVAMRIAVVTPYFKEPIEKIRRCHQSVLNQTHRDVTHIMVADGFPQPEIDAWERCQHIALPVGHNDSGDTPRMVGCSSAAAQRYQGIVLLDADNWFDPGHIEKLIQVQEQSQAVVVTCSRKLCRPDTGEVLATCWESDGVKFCDTNCYLVTDAAFHLLAAWGLRDNQTARQIGNIGDRLFWQAVVNSRVRRAHSDTLTVNYETTWASHYRTLGLPIPEFAKMPVWSAEEQGYRIVLYHEWYRRSE
jgi:glycosyltransferase involved in cell wall biosynthesis